MVTLNIGFDDLTKFPTDQELKTFIVDSLADVMVSKISAVKAELTRPADVALTDKGIDVGITIGGHF